MPQLFNPEENPYDLREHIFPQYLGKVDQSPIDLTDERVADFLCTGVVAHMVRHAEDIDETGSDKSWNAAVQHQLQSMATNEETPSSTVPVFSLPLSPAFTPLDLLEFFNRTSGGDPVKYDENFIRSITLGAFNCRLLTSEKSRGINYSAANSIEPFSLLKVGRQAEPRNTANYHSSIDGCATFADYLQAQWLLRKLGKPQIEGTVWLTRLDVYNHLLIAHATEWSITLGKTDSWVVNDVSVYRS